MKGAPTSVNVMAAEDLLALAWLHESERTPQTLIELHASEFASSLSLLPATHAACLQMSDALTALASQPQPLPQACTDDLAAEFAAIYLTHSYRAAPYESVWHDEENLMMQAPTFEVRAFYDRHDFQVANWRHMPDDHISHQLRFTAFLLQQGDEREAARFLKTHLMTWLPRFAQQVGERAQTRFYAALAALTLACVEACLAQLPKVAVIPTVRAQQEASGCGAGAR